MTITNEIVVPATRSAFWSTVTDPQKLTQAMPGGAIVARDGDTWQADVRVRTSLGESRFAFTLWLGDRVEGERISVTGRGYGAQHALDLRATLVLADEGDATVVAYDATVTAGGILASVAQRSLPYVMRREIDAAIVRLGAR